MPVVFRSGAYKFFFYSDEGTPREPPHIHVRHGQDEAKFWLQPDVSLAYSDGFDAPTVNRLQKLVEHNRDDLERAWHDYFA